MNREEILKWYPEVLVLGPGGMKGFLELGALIKLYNIGILEKVHTYIGCSIGAIISLLLISGYSPTELVSDAVETNILQDITSLQLNDIKTQLIDIKNNVGLINNKLITDKLSKRLRQKFGFVPTLKQLYLATGITFISVTLNLDLDKTEYISWKNEPDLSAVDAAALSMNIPFLFYKLTYKGNNYIDGAFGNPYPIDIIDDNKTNILGLYITTMYDKNINKNIFTYVDKIIHASISQIKLRILSSCSDHCKHIELLSPITDTTGITVNSELKSKMLLNGYQEATKFINSLLENNENIEHSNDILDITNALSIIQNYNNDFYDSEPEFDESYSN